MDYVNIVNNEPLSRAFGARLLYRPEVSLAGTSISVTRERNVPSVVVELGGGDVDQSAYIARGIAGLANILRTVRMLPGEAVPPPPQVVLREIATLTLRPHEGGLLLPEVSPIDGEVSKDNVLGRIVSPYSRSSAVHSPAVGANRHGHRVVYGRLCKNRSPNREGRIPSPNWWQPSRGRDTPMACG